MTRTSASAAFGLDFRLYHEPSVFRAEHTRIFDRRWTAVCFASDVPDVGDALPVALGARRLLIVRAGAEDVRAFDNSGPWDGCLILDQPRHGLDRLTGPYHGWTWSLQGELQSAPYRDGTSSPDIEGADDDLDEIRSVMWHDLVLVHLAEGRAVAAPLASLDRRTARFDLTTFVPARAHDGDPVRLRRRIAGNWKIAVENDIDVYHEAFVHRSYADSDSSPKCASNGARTFTPVDDGDLFGLEAPVTQYFDDETATMFPQIPLVEGTHDRVAILDAYPNVLASFFVHHFMLGLYRPLAPDVTDLEVGLYLHESIADDAGISELLLAPWIEARDEDNRIVAQAQHGRAARPGVYRPNPFWDGPTESFHRRILEDLGEHLGRGGDPS